MNRRLAPALVACALLAGGLAAAPAHAATTHQVPVQVRNNFFQPATVQIQPGDTIVWTARDGGHTVTADDGRFDFNLPDFLDTAEWTAGQTEERVGYFCQVHEFVMRGQIVVGDPPPPPPPPPLPTLIVPDDVATIAAAAAGAQPGTIVLVRPGIYREEVTVTVPDLTIRGLGENPAGVVLDGQHTTDVGITIQAPGVRIANLTVASHRHTGVRAEARPPPDPPDGDGRRGGDGAVLSDIVIGGDGAVLSDVVIDDNGYYGVDLQGRSGLTLRNVTATRHTIAGVAVRDCPQCGARLDDVTLERNGVGLLAHDATGLIVRGSTIRDNAAGIVLRDSAGATVAGNTLTGNAATDVRTASVFTPTVPLWTGAGVWVSGGLAHHIRDNILSGHTYNVAVTGPLPVLDTRIQANTVDKAIHGDLGWDGVGARVCFNGNSQPDGTEPTSDPPAAQTIYDCALPTTAGLPYPVVTANLAAHAAAHALGLDQDTDPT